MRIGLGIGIPQFQGNGSSGIAASINFAQLVTGDVPSGWTFTRSTSGTYFDASGVLQLASTNVLRISRDPVSGELGYLAEPGRTNLATYSQDFSAVGAHPQANTTVTVAGTTAPDGTLTGNRIQATASASTTMRMQATIAATAAAYSVFVKKGTSATVGNVFRLRNITTGTDLIVGTVNLDTGAVAYSTGSSGLSAIDHGNGWWRVFMVASSGITSGDAISGYCGASSTALTAGDYWFLWGEQMEAASYSTSYIPTTTVAVSRGADLLTTTLSAAHAAALSVAGTMVARFTSYNDDSTNLYGVASVYTSTAAEHTIYRYKSWHGSRTIASGTQYDQQATASSGVPHKFAHAWEVDNCRGASDGTLTAADAAPSTMPAVTTVGIGARSGGTNQPIGLIHSFALYTSRLTDAQLQALTA